MLHLPPWATDAAGRSAIASILADPPETSVHRTDWGLQEYYSPNDRPDVAVLRRMHKRWLTDELRKIDEQYAITGVWVDASSDAIFREEDADRLIKRVLRESAEQQFVEVEHLAPGRIAA